MTEKEFDKKWNPVYKERIKNSHNESAPETKLKLQALEIHQQTIMDKLLENQVTNEKAHDNLMNSITEFHTTTTLAIEKITLKLDSALEKKADKAVVDRMITILFWLGGVIGTGILGYIGLQIVKVIEKL